MTHVFARAALVFVVALAVSLPGAAQAVERARVDGAQLELIATRAADGGVDIAIDVVLDPGYKTYWRQPGDSGVPPFFDWSASRNLTVAGVDHPYPIRFSDGYGTSLGHDAQVTLPVRAMPVDPAADVKIAVTIDMGVCREICVPVRVQLATDLPVGAHDAGAARVVAAARASLPVKVDRAAQVLANPSDSRRVRVVVAGASEMVVDGPAEWSLPLPVMVPGAPQGTFEFELDGIPKSATVSGTPVTVTYMTPEGPRETAAVLP